MRRGRLLLIVLLAFASSVRADNIKLQNIDRKISLNSQFVRVTEDVKAKNIGSYVVSDLIICEPVVGDAVVAFFKVVETSSKHALTVLLTTVPDAPAEAVCYKVKLANPLPPSDHISLTVTAVIARAQIPYPAEVTQHQKQLMLYKGYLYVLSPYSVSSQTTEVVLPTSIIKSYTDVKPLHKSGSKLKYGKYDLIKPFTIKELSVHFENNKPFKQILNFVKEIEVSHWGNIYVEETYEIKNAGAKHTGSFSRTKYTHTNNGQANSFRDLKAVLPASARSLYYVDLIGNISTSSIRKSSALTTLDVELRYPLMGGWKADFTIGYSVPLEGFLTTNSGRRRLTMDLSSPLEDVFIEDMVVRVVLPEGAANIQAVLPYEVEQSFDIKYTYLDTTGRPVLVLHKTNVVAPDHIAKFSVDYDFNTIHNLREPLLLVCVFFGLFVAVIVYNRTEFTITRDEKWEAAHSKEVLGTYMEQIQALCEDKVTTPGGLSRATKIRDVADVDAVQRGKAKVEKRLKDLEEKVKPL